MNKVSSGETKKPLLCSFCGKSQHEVRKLIAGPTCLSATTRRRPLSLPKTQSVGLAECSCGSGKKFPRCYGASETLH
jgi:ClpX C4-type zinc finger